MLECWTYLGCKTIADRVKHVGKEANDGQDFDDIFYSSGESDTEFIAPFNDLSTEEKSQRLTFLWQRAYRRARGGSILIQKIKFIRDKNRLYGMSPDKDAKNEDHLTVAKKDAKCVIFPDNKFI